MTGALRIDPHTPTASAIFELHLLSDRLQALRESLLASGHVESADRVKAAAESVFGAITAYVRQQVQR